MQKHSFGLVHFVVGKRDGVHPTPTRDAGKRRKPLAARRLLQSQSRVAFTNVWSKFLGLELNAECARLISDLYLLVAGFGSQSMIDMDRNDGHDLLARQLG